MIHNLCIEDIYLIKIVILKGYKIQNVEESINLL